MSKRMNEWLCEDLDPGQCPVQGRLGVVGDQDRGDLEQGADLEQDLLHGDFEM